MARYRGSALVGAISGTVGGVEFALGKTSGTVKGRRRNRQTISPAQAEMLAAVQNHTAWYAASTPELRLAWDTFAAANPRTNGLGQTVNWTGRQASLKYHSFLFDWLDRVLPPAITLQQPPLWTNHSPYFQSLTVNFVAGGPYETNAQCKSAGVYSRQVLYAARTGNGSRGGATNMRFIGAKAFFNSPIDWYTMFTRARTNWELQSGEHIRIRIRNLGFTGFTWPNYPWEWDLTVS